MNKKGIYFAGGFVLAAIAGIFAALAPQQDAAKSAKIAVVNFKDCLENSNTGKQELKRFEDMKKEMEKTMEAKEKELNEMAPKFKADYLDTLTPEAEAELKEKFKVLSSEFSQQQNQFYQIMNQANYQIIGNLTQQIEKAAEKVAKDKGIDFVLNKEACFFASSSVDISKEVSQQVDKDAPKESQKPVEIEKK